MATIQAIGGLDAVAADEHGTERYTNHRDSPWSGPDAPRERLPSEYNLRDGLYERSEIAPELFSWVLRPRTTGTTATTSHEDLGLEKGKPVLQILSPRNHEQMPILEGEATPVIRPISGVVNGFSRHDIEVKGLFVETTIRTDRYYKQGVVGVLPDGTWTFDRAFFGSRRDHTIIALLKDSDGRQYASQETHASLVDA